MTKKFPVAIKAAVLLPGGRKDHRQDAAQLVQFAEGGSRLLDVAFGLFTPTEELMLTLMLTVIGGTLSYCPHMWGLSCPDVAADDDPDNNNAVHSNTAGQRCSGGRLWDGGCFKTLAAECESLPN